MWKVNRVSSCVSMNVPEVLTLNQYMGLRLILQLLLAQTSIFLS